MAKHTRRFDGSVPSWAVDLIVEAIVAFTETRIPRPVIRTAVKAVVGAAAVVEIADIKGILGGLGLPPSIAGLVWNRFTAEADEVAELECPESGDTITLEEGDGFYTCPACKQEIEVEQGVAYHPLLVSCPATGKEVWAHYEEDSYSCPECGLEIVVADGDAKHQRAPKTRRTGKKKPHRRTFK
jgi:predicted RNA-binding Zn-ribbon protein involved in translation (DUF1610 family)